MNITASEARKLSNANSKIRRLLTAIEQVIKEAAAQGETSAYYYVREEDYQQCNLNDLVEAVEVNGFRVDFNQSDETTVRLDIDWEFQDEE